MLLVEGDGFANTLPSYDAIYPGHWTNTDRLEPFTIHLDDFEASFIEEGDLRGQPASYVADITYKDSPEAEEQQHRLEVRSEEHTSELQSRFDLVCRLLLEKKK